MSFSSFINRLSKAEVRFSNACNRMRGFLLTFYLKAHGCKIGKRLKCKRWPIFRSIPNGNIHIGDDVGIGFFITFDVSEKGRLILGNSVNLTHNVIIGACDHVAIGNYTLIAENVSIRDSEHETFQDMRIALQGNVSAPITIEDDVWIGAGVVVLKGAKVSKGAVIGAYSVVTARSEVNPYCIYAGIPVRQIGCRRPLVAEYQTNVEYSNAPNKIIT